MTPGVLTNGTESIRSVGSADNTIHVVMLSKKGYRIFVINPYEDSSVFCSSRYICVHALVSGSVSYLSYQYVKGPSREEPHKRIAVQLYGSVA